MEKLKDLWDRYPRTWVDVAALLGFSVTVAWAVATYLVEITDLQSLPSHPIWLKILLVASISGAICLTFDIAYYFWRRGGAIRLVRDIDKIFCTALADPNCSEVLVFASSGEDAKKRFLSLTKFKFSPKRSIRIRVLLRTDQSAGRQSSLEHLVYTWHKDIDQITKINAGGYHFTTEFSLYESPVMLKGYIFGESSAAVSWYARNSFFRSSPTMPNFIVNGQSEEGVEVIREAKSLFEINFQDGKRI